MGVLFFRDCESIRFPRKWRGETAIFHAKSYTTWDKKEDFVLNLGKLCRPVPLDLKIQEYFHSLSSVGTLSCPLQRTQLLGADRRWRLAYRGV